MGSNTRWKDIETKESRNKKLKKLMNTLGVEKMIQYLNIKYGDDTGDYTEEREEILKRLKEEDLKKFLNKKRQEEF